MSSGEPSNIPESKIDIVFDYTALVTALDSLVDKIAGDFNREVQSGIGETLSSLSKALNKFGDSLSNLFEGMKSIKDVGVGGPKSSVTLFTTKGAAIQDVIYNVKRLSNLYSDLSGVLQEGHSIKKEELDTVRVVVHSVTEAIKKSFGEVSNQVNEFQKSMQGGVEGVDNTTQQIQDFVKNLHGLVTTLVGEMKQIGIPPSVESNIQSSLGRLKRELQEVSQEVELGMGFEDFFQKLSQQDTFREWIGKSSEEFWSRMANKVFAKSWMQQVAQHLKQGKEIREGVWEQIAKGPSNVAAASRNMNALVGSLLSGIDVGRGIKIYIGYRLISVMWEVIHSLVSPLLRMFSYSLEQAFAPLQWALIDSLWDLLIVLREVLIQIIDPLSEALQSVGKIIKELEPVFRFLGQVLSLVAKIVGLVASVLNSLLSVWWVKSIFRSVVGLLLLVGTLYKVYQWTVLTWTVMRNWGVFLFTFVRDVITWCYNWVKSLFVSSNAIRQQTLAIQENTSANTTCSSERSNSSECSVGGGIGRKGRG